MARRRPLVQGDLMLGLLYSTGTLMAVALGKTGVLPRSCVATCEIFVAWEILDQAAPREPLVPSPVLVRAQIIQDFWFWACARP